MSNSDIPLTEYVKARQLFCSSHHRAPCCMCKNMLQVAVTVLEQGYILLPCAFRIVSSEVSYTAERARRKLLQMPLVSIRVGDPGKGTSFTILMEHCIGVNYHRMGLVINRMVITTPQNAQRLERSCVQMLLSMAQSDRERECIKYAIYKASGLSSTKARHLYGFENMKKRATRVESAMLEVQKIYETVENIARVQDKALLASFGIPPEESDSSDDEADDQLISENVPALSTSVVAFCKAALTQSNFNFFGLLDALEAELEGDAHEIAEQYFRDCQRFGFTQQQLDLIIQSKEAYTAARQDASDSERTVCVLDGCIVTDSEEETSQLFATANDPMSPSAKLLISKRRLAIQRRKRRLRAKAIVDGRILSRKTSSKIGGILSTCPNIGKVIEDFVSDHNIGADSWRRTGVLTFDGNTRLPQKVTYERIRHHLIKVYNRHFSYGSVVQLCVARNKRRCSSKCYRGVAKVTTQRARKGFNLRFNPDTHWSAAFYKGLNELQLKDGRDMCLINRDDASGFRLDTLTTCKQYASPTLKGHEVLTTRTDYVNKYPSLLQTTSYNFTATQTTEEVCVGVVKAPTSIHPKNPCQHAADLSMLMRQKELKPAFYNIETDTPKAIDCVRVDGASDEGPSHEEVQFYWTQRHLLNSKLATLVTTRSSGSSYLNRVELQNGCLSRGHSGTFIPSTLAGSCIDPDTGNVNTIKLAENMNLAIDAYISRVNHSPCGDTVIKLFRGADSSEDQEVRKKLLTFLKGSSENKRNLRSQAPELYANFELVWIVRNSHMVKGLSSYIFFLICCYQNGCPHPRCQAGYPQSPLTWYLGGPSLYLLPLPFPDAKQPWGSTCEKCEGACSGHYVTQTVDVRDTKALSKAPKPPSTVLKQLFSEGAIRQSSMESIAKQVLLPCDECEIWLNHLQTVLQNRQRGAKKAAATRRAKSLAMKQKQGTAQHVASSETDVQVNKWEKGGGTHLWILF